MVNPFYVQYLTAYIYCMNTLLMCYKRILHSVGTSMLIIAVPSHIFALTFRPSFGLVKSRRKMHGKMFDFPSADQRLPYCDKEGGWAWFSWLKKRSRSIFLAWQEINKQEKRTTLFLTECKLSRQNSIPFLVTVSDIAFDLFHDLDFMSLFNCFSCFLERVLLTASSGTTYFVSSNWSIKINHVLSLRI